MSLNWAMVSADGRPVPLPGEKAILELEAVALVMTTGTGYPGSSRAWRANEGRLFLTSERLVYLAATRMGEEAAHGGSATTALSSLSVPLEHLHKGTYIQPWFAANRYEATVQPVAHGGLPGPAKLTLVFQAAGGDAFQTAVVQASASRRARRQGEEEEVLPRYEGDGLVGTTGDLPSTDTSAPVLDNSPAPTTTVREPPPEYV